MGCLFIRRTEGILKMLYQHNLGGYSCSLVPPDLCKSGELCPGHALDNELIRLSSTARNDEQLFLHSLVTYSCNMGLLNATAPLHLQLNSHPMNIQKSVPIF